MSLQIMKLVLNTARVFVSSISKARTFYADTLQLPLDMDGAQHRYLLFRPGPLTLLVEASDLTDESGDKLVGRFTGLSFDVENIQSTYEDLHARGVPFHGPPEKQEWGGTLAFFADPDGNGYSLCQLG